MPLAGARAATSVNFVGWQGYDTPLSDYAKANDIVFDATYIGDSNQIISKLTSGGVGTVDIVTPNAIYVPLLVKLDTLAAIDEAKVPNLPKVLPFFLNNPAVRIDGKLYAIPYVWGGVPMMYDPAVIPTAPESWKDLLKPEYTGKVAMLDNLNNILLAAKVVTDAAVPTRLTQGPAEGRRRLPAGGEEAERASSPRATATWPTPWRAAKWSSPSTAGR